MYKVYVAYFYLYYKHFKNSILFQNIGISGGGLLKVAFVRVCVCVCVCVRERECVSCPHLEKTNDRIPTELVTFIVKQCMETE